MTPLQYTPGSLIHARGREWIVQPGSVPPLLRLRPLSGAEEEGALIHIELEPSIESAHFPLPDPAREGGQGEAVLLADALRMALRRGAGPFRSFGNIAVEPRTYQLVPLLMALRLDPVRLLIADDVGIGKTIEAALIARELQDRGEIQRLAILCPPHLVEQWVRELVDRFHLNAVAVTATSAARLERGVPVGESLFQAHPVTVVSLDYIKSERHRHDFIRACPEFVIVDEAHTCVSVGRGRQLRFELLRALAANDERHLVLLTATPHSGDQDAFYGLLSLLKKEFAALATAVGDGKDKLRERLALHFVQRRRPDIDEWRDGSLFPQRKTTEITYRLSGKWDNFFQSALNYCREVVQRAGDDEHRQRLNFWGTLALMRCIASSPAAAVQALRTRLAAEQQTPEDFVESLFDGAEDALDVDDVVPAADTGDPALRALLEEGEALASAKNDPKLRLLTGHLKQLLDDGFNPVVFCRYIATARYLYDHLRDYFRGVMVEIATGEFPAEERERRVDALGDADRRLLIATDCLSEGINLQEHLDAVVHYDLSWNPTRHEQREGRVDRFGQSSPNVRATLIYGANNPVDGAVLQVILRKAEKIRQELGVPVPLPDDDHTLTQALMKAVILRGGHGGQTGDLFDFNDDQESRALDIRWTDLAEKVKKNRTVFAQRRLRPADVLPEWERIRTVLGSGEDVKRFADQAMARLGAVLSLSARGATAPITALPPILRERLAAEGIDGDISIDFKQPPAPRCRFIHRSHPLIATLADELLERSLTAENRDGQQLATLGRIGVWRSPAVQSVTAVLLLRLRHQISASHSGRSQTLLVEEALPVARQGRNDPVELQGEQLLAWLQAPAQGNLPDGVRQREMDNLLEMLGKREQQLERLADLQAERLLADHRRVREAADARGRYEVRALKPVDVIAAYVLLPGGVA